MTQIRLLTALEHDGAHYERDSELPTEAAGITDEQLAALLELGVVEVLEASAAERIEETPPAPVKKANAAQAAG